jgi:hypothetical protein
VVIFLNLKKTTMDILNTLAIIMLFVIAIVGVYVVIFIHDIPYEIAKKRKHPHQDAIHIAGWVSLFLLHTIWPFLWIWAYLYKPDSPALVTVKADLDQVSELKNEIAQLRKEVTMLKEGKVEEIDGNGGAKNDKGPSVDSGKSQSKN